MYQGEPDHILTGGRFVTLDAQERIVTGLAARAGPALPGRGRRRSGLRPRLTAEPIVGAADHEQAEGRWDWPGAPSSATLGPRQRSWVAGTVWEIGKPTRTCLWGESWSLGVSDASSR
jgi:hypothetical protein